MRKILLGVLLFAGSAAAQVTPDCVINFNLTAALQATVTTGCGNNTLGITDWRMAYLNVGGGFSALNIVVQSSPNNSAWSTFAGNVIDGTNPNTNTSENSVKLSGFNAYVRVYLASATGSGTIRGVLYGCRNPGCSTIVSANAIISGLLDVQGPVAAGIAETGNPVQMGGVDPGGLARYLRSNTAGDQAPANAATANADGIANTNNAEVDATGASVIYDRVLPYAFNGSTWDRAFSCPNTARVNATASGNNQIIALSGTTRIRICNLVGTTDAGAPLNISITYGTGVNCASGTTTLAGSFDLVTALDLFSAAAPLTVPAAQAACLNLSAATAFEGTVIYAQY